VPHESYHTLGEVKRWFRENNLIMLGHKNIRNERFEIANFLEKKTIFFVAGKQNKI